MALINCSECGGQISDKAVACPGCGCPTFTPSPNKVQEATVGADKAITLKAARKLATQEVHISPLPFRQLDSMNNCSIGQNAKYVDSSNNPTATKTFFGILFILLGIVSVFGVVTIVVAVPCFILGANLIKGEFKR